MSPKCTLFYWKQNFTHVVSGPQVKVVEREVLRDVVEMHT